MNFKHRFKYWLLVFKDYPALVNRCAKIEQRLYDCYQGKRHLPTKKDCWQMYRILGTGSDK